MGLGAWLGLDSDTGANGTETKPIVNGTPQTVTNQPTASTGFFGWLDDLGEFTGKVAGQAVNVVADGWIKDLEVKNAPAVKTPDVTPVASDSKLPINTSFFEANKTYIMYGGIGVAAVALLLTLRK